MKEINTIVIPKGLPTNIQKYSEDIPCVCTYLKLKTLYVGGVIFNFSSRTKEIAIKFNMGSSTLRDHINKLIKLGLVEKNKNNKSLILKSKRVLKELYNTSKFNYKVNKTEGNLIDIKCVIDTLLIDELLERQNFKLKQNILIERLVKKSIITSQEGKIMRKNPSKIVISNGKRRLISKEKRFIESNFNEIKLNEQSRFQSQVRNTLFSNNNSSILLKKDFKNNPFTTISRFHLAKSLSRKSSSTGSRRINKLKTKGFINDDTNSLIISNQVDYIDINTMNDYNYYNELGYLFTKDNKVMIKLTNNIKSNSSQILFYSVFSNKEV